MPDTSDLTLSQAMHAAAAASADTSGIYPLPIAQEAFAARCLLARAAERSLDVQYYIWHGDTTGYLLLQDLWSAAERGVRVRLLLDDNGVTGLDPTIAALDSHHNIEIRLFNPFPNRRFKSLGYLSDFRRLNRRMHNKSFTADSEATIVGGRNVGDEYFGAGQRMLFSDLDVLAVGPVAREVAQAFEQYWNDASAHRADSVVGKPPSDAVATLLTRFSAVRASPEAVEYLEALRATRLVDALLSHQLRLEWVQVRLMCDPPEKTRGKAPDAELVFAKTYEALGHAEREIDLVSPYFVPGRKGTKALARFAEGGIDLRILTNSLSATDVGLVHAGYAKRRRPLLRSRARIYELKAHFGETAQPNPGAEGGRRMGSSSASLHAKTFSVDRSRVFVGSLNLDPRSVRLNTEMGLVIESPSLARAIATEVDRAAERSAYEVVLDGSGRRLEWVEQTAHGQIRYRSEPKSSFARRMAIGVLAWLPIEGLL